MERHSSPAQASPAQDASPGRGQAQAQGSEAMTGWLDALIWMNAALVWLSVARMVHLPSYLNRWGETIGWAFYRWAMSPRNYVRHSPPGPPEIPLDLRWVSKP
jgi:hypothetical protein